MLVIVSQQFDRGDETLLAPTNRSQSGKWRRHLTTPVEGDLVNLSDDDKDWEPSQIGIPTPFLGEGQSPEEILSQIESAQKRMNNLRTYIYRLEQELLKKRHGEV